MGELKFVVVDDAVFMRTLIKRMIEENTNYHVVGEGANGREAIEQAKRSQPDIMTLDITMPEMDGIMAIKEILEVSPATKIIMVSAMGQQAMVIDAIKMGAKDFIVKPFDKTRVQQAIENVINL
ncbi:LOW QUALITY PROTEIN: response regulator receiver protein [Ruminiclostridium papyrosolvens DSM 2782]|uniref:Stage 0 sporulation protein A homolog n=1 Tax=Ruminiclostridium papyrosolvens DSM 2782 TaxID=588581 RepID=F1T9T7_9FIRM|nr:response regulator [Ruminiclostridium papyrosolvens]EGD48679.1 LOW QUALITY PROTEIN: response regulator receiver protein [Ruminiclostridium papyrosolvens DSM 2782]WES32563.1 response regulator [Ruminiclostridium papyrosolvens DSM 2782]